MISSLVTAFDGAIIRLTVRGPLGHEREIEAIIDTGFTGGSLTLPPSMIRDPALSWRRSGRAILADGTESLFDTYDATLLWDGTLRRISVDAADTDPLVGMSLLRGHQLSMDIISGGSVTISRLP